MKKLFSNKHLAHQAKYGAKKHISQMDELEKDFLFRQFHAVDRIEWVFTDYSQKRFTERKIDPTHFLTLWKDAELVEFHQKSKTNRILLRSRAVHKDAQVCAVFDITNKTIVTVYLNWVNNKHENLKEEFYDAKLDVIAAYKGVK